MTANRSYEIITKSDLRHLGELAKIDRNDFFARKPKWAIYSDRIICVALCQGAALHYIDLKNGVKDFDVWTFYIEHPAGPFPYRRRGRQDFGISKFGKSPQDKGKYVGRSVDLLGRSLKLDRKMDPIETIQSYLKKGKTESARFLSKKAVVLIEPPEFCGKVIWPFTNHRK